MRSKRRVVAATALLLASAPGNIVHEHVSWDPPENVAFTKIEGVTENVAPGWSIGGIWELSGEGLLFGGFSALIAVQDGRLMAFSDRGARFIFTEPDIKSGQSTVARQILADDRTPAIPDIEAATFDSATGEYWLAFENDHSIDRFRRDSSPRGARDMNSAAVTFDWSNNSGAEAFTRLSDGRFALLAEGERTGFLFPDDPVDGANFDVFAYLPPAPGYGATDMVQLPDGRILLLVRTVDPWGGIPPFDTKIALGPVPKLGDGEVWKPQITLSLGDVVPRENFEGIAVRPMADGRVAVWLISDDNLSVMQRTLLVKLIFDPADTPIPDKAKGARK